MNATPDFYFRENCYLFSLFSVEIKAQYITLKTKNQEHVTQKCKIKNTQIKLLQEKKKKKNP